jgi:transcription initiation factor IIF auxiliary subunit
MINKLNKKIKDTKEYIKKLQSLVIGLKSLVVAEESCEKLWNKTMDKAKSFIKEGDEFDLMYSQLPTDEDMLMKETIEKLKDRIEELKYWIDNIEYSKGDII